MWIRTKFALFLLTLLGLTCAATKSEKNLPERTASMANQPNVIVIIADDLGYGDVSLYQNKEMITPNLETLAKEGVLVTAGYVTAPVCSPSRAGLLTGRYQQRFGFEYNVGPGRRTWEEQLGLPREEKTLAEEMKKLGYTTGMVGKWHIGSRPQFHPRNRGFDYFFGILDGATLYADPDREDIESGIVSGEAAIVTARKRNVFNQVFRDTTPVDNMDKYLTDEFTAEAVQFIKSNKDKPFFLYVPYNAPHSPLQAPKKYTAPYKDIAFENRRIYRGMINALDQGVGQINQTLKDLKLDKNTLVFFLSDNGCASYTFACCMDTPLKGSKLTHYEGGFRVPFVAKWPAKFKPGTKFTLPVSSMDIFTTSIRAAGGNIPSDRIIDGVDLAPYFTGKNTSAPHEVLYWRNGFFKTVRKGPWKLYKSVLEGQSFTYLFNIEEDLGENKEVSKKYPEIVRELERMLDEWEKQLQAPKWESKGSTEVPVNGLMMKVPV